MDYTADRRSQKRSFDEFDDGGGCDLPPGPKSFSQMMGWRDSVAADFCADKGRVMRLIKLCAGGIDISSHYSGLRTAEIGCIALADAEKTAVEAWRREVRKVCVGCLYAESEMEGEKQHEFVNLAENIEKVMSSSAGPGGV